MSRSYDRAMDVLNRAIGEPTGEPSHLPPCPRWWCADHDIIESTKAADLVRPRCPECGEPMVPYSELTDNPTRQRRDWKP